MVANISPIIRKKIIIKKNKQYKEDIARVF